MSLSYRFLIADGQVMPALAALLEASRDLFPNLDVTYIRYPDDRTFSVFYTKMLDAVGRITTPYTMVVDNDDFVVQSGIERSLDFLDVHRDYVCCGGGVSGFAVFDDGSVHHQGLLGSLNRLAYRYAPLYRSCDYSSDSALERLKQGSRDWWPYYAVYRTPVLVDLWRDAVEIDFSDLQLLEMFSTMRTLTAGKSRSDNGSVTYLRQYGTSMQSALKKDWVHHLLRSRFTNDFNAMVARISSLAAMADGIETDIVSECLREIGAGWLRGFLIDQYGTMRRIKSAIRAHAPRLVAAVQNRRRRSIGRERERYLSQIEKEGATAAYMKTFRKELAAIEDVFSGIAFAEFIHPFIASLTPSVPQGAERVLPQPVAN